MDNPVEFLKDKKVQMVAIPVAVLAGLYVVYRYRKASLADETTTTMVVNPASGTAVDAQQGDAVADTSTSDTTGSTSVIGTNDEWTRVTVERLTSIGYDPAMATTALSLYLAGQPLSTDQVNLVRSAIGLSGNPPGGKYEVIRAPATETSTTPSVPSSSTPTAVVTQPAKVKPVATKPTPAASPVAAQPAKPPAKAGYDIVWHKGPSNVYQWVYMKSAAPATPTQPAKPPAKAGYKTVWQKGPSNVYRWVYVKS